MTLDEIKDKISSYAALVADGHETYDDAMDSVLGIINCLTDENDIESAYDHRDQEFLSL